MRPTPIPRAIVAASLLAVPAAAGDIDWRVVSCEVGEFLPGTVELVVRLDVDAPALAPGESVATGLRILLDGTPIAADDAVTVTLIAADPCLPPGDAGACGGDACTVRSFASGSGAVVVSGRCLPDGGPCDCDPGSPPALSLVIARPQGPGLIEIRLDPDDLVAESNELNNACAIAFDPASFCTNDESFDGYLAGSDLHGQDGWTGWDGDPAFGAPASDAVFRSFDRSVEVGGAADLVREHCATTSGLWSYTAWQYIPSEFTSAGGGFPVGSWFILLDTYDHGGPYHWAVQVGADSATGTLKVFHGDGLSTVQVPYDTDRWVRLEAIIDLDDDWTRIYYDDDLVTEYPWTGGVLGDGGGALDIAAVDLYANASSPVYYDDLALDPIIGCGALDEDADGDGLNLLAEHRLTTDSCNPDSDGDGVDDGIDNCPTSFNPDQADTDDDGIGDACLLPACPEPCGPDLTGDGTVDGADLGVLLGGWGPCAGCPADLSGDGTIDGADLGLLLGAWGPCPPPACAAVYPATLQFWTVPRGLDARTEFIVANTGDLPLTLADVTVADTTAGPQPYFWIIDHDPVIEPDSIGRVHVGFEPGAPDAYLGEVMIVTDPPTPAPIVGTIVGGATDVTEVPLESSTELFVEEESIAFEDGVGVTRHYAITVPAVGPTLLHDAEMELSMELLGGDLPPKMEVAFSRTTIPLGETEYAQLTMFTPTGTPPFDFTFTVNGLVFQGVNPLFTVTAVPLLAFGNEPDIPDPCFCTPPTMTPLLLQSKTVNAPDASPPTPQTPGGHPVAKITALLWGPKPGQCCNGAKFRLEVIVDSAVNGTSTDMTAFILTKGKCGQDGYSVTTSTNGTSQPVNWGSGNQASCNPPLGNDIAKAKRTVLKTSVDVPVHCEADPECSCSVSPKKLKTVFATAGPFVGSVAVHATIGVTGSLWTLSSVTATIDRFVFTRDSNVYDPVNDEFIPATGDEDGDGVSNIREVEQGTNPQQP